MKKDATRRDYSRRITRVVDFIHDNLDGDLSIERLSTVAHFSPYHLHRIFHAMTGNTVAETVRRLRLHRAASDLLLPQRTIEDVATRAGYASVEAFTRAFRNAYGNPPGAYRTKRLAAFSIEFLQSKGADMHDVTVKSLPAIELATLPHLGEYLEIGRTFEKLVIEAGAAGLMGPDTRSIGIYFDDPEATPVEELKSKAGLTIKHAKLTKMTNAEATTIPGGRHAILRHTGPYSDLLKSYRWLFGVWLPESGEEAANRPCFEEYVNDPTQTPPSELLTDIHLPLEDRA